MATQKDKEAAEKRYDELEADGTIVSIVLWLNSVVGEDHTPIPSSTERDFHNHLQDGIMLCKVINKLLESVDKPPVSFRQKVVNAFAAFNKIESFESGALEYGLDKKSFFEKTDLWEGGKAGMLDVIHCLHALGTAAFNNGFQPIYTGIRIKSFDD